MSAGQAVEAAARKAAAEEADTPMPDADAEVGALPGPPAGALSADAPPLSALWVVFVEDGAQACQLTRMVALGLQFILQATRLSMRS